MALQDRIRTRTALRAAPLLAAALCAAQPAQAQSDFLYDLEYPDAGYSHTPAANPVAELIGEMESGETRLEYRPERGYLDSLLEALDIDPASQVLVYSKTSLQYALIGSATPRAVYFNDTAYVGFVQNSDIVEIAVMDAELGPVFYTFRNEAGETSPFHRETSRCLNCHDTYGMMGGGVPILPVRSTLVRSDGAPLTVETPLEVTDATPLAERWGGWYVTGQHGGQTHMGNVLIQRSAELEDARLGNIDTLEGLFDTGPYLTDTSDIVALMVLEHQLRVQNEIAYVNFKAPAVLDRLGHPEAADAQSWDELPERARTMLPRMLDKLADAILMVGAVTLDEPVRGSAGFEDGFQARGPRDAEGRSLRDLDLDARLFAYPLSFEIYSAAFDHLPPYAREYVYRRIDRALASEDDIAHTGHDAETRRAARDILIATKPDFARFAEAEAS